ncbi:MAG: hypothetical protein NTZ74_04705 [Chloroflexi bacterium]|nr:hypothetical protein [Chloroflexota bacterium]
MLCLYDYSIHYTPDKNDYERAAIPWFSIAITRRWLELSDLVDLRQELINELNGFRSYYLRGLEAAAVALERIVWNTLFRFFNFAKGGNLVFYVNIGDDQNKNRRGYDEGRQVDLIPFTQINNCFEDFCQDQKEKEKLEASINWFVKMLITYQEELGLVKNNRPNKQTKMLCEENPPKQDEYD